LAVVLRNPSTELLAQLNGPLRGYILSELNAWDLTIVEKEDEDQWVNLSLAPNFAILGKKLGKQIGQAKKVLTGMSHKEAIAALESGSVTIGDNVLDCKTEVLTKLSFCREGDMWESIQSDAGNVVVAIDCTQDEAILNAGKAREFMNHVQQLRKAAGLDISDAIEVFFHEEEGLSSARNAIVGNLDIIVGKLNIQPIDKKFMSQWSVILDEGEFEVGGSKVEIIITRPSVCVKHDVMEPLRQFLSTVDPSEVKEKEVVSCLINGEKFTVTEGVEFWISAARMVSI